MEKRIRQLFTTNLLPKAAGLILGFLLWLVLSNIQNPIIERNLTLTVEYDDSYLEENNYVAISRPSSVIIPIRVRRSNYAKVSAEDFTANVDTAQYLGAGINDSSEATRFVLNITKATTATYIEDWSYPKTTGQYIDITVDTIKTQRYAVEFNLIGELSSELQAMNPIANPARVTVTGPTSDFANVMSVKATVDLSQITAENNAITAELHLYDGNNRMITNKALELSQDTVEVTVEIAQTKEVGLTVNYMGEPASGYGIRSFDYNPKTIVVTGSASAIAAMQSANVIIPKAAVNITGLSESKTFSLIIEDYLPSGLSVAEGQTEEVTVSCQIEELEERSFTINTDIFEFMGTDEQYEYEIVSEYTQIVLRAFSDALDSFPETGGGLRGTINVSGMVPGSATSYATVMISIDGQYSLVNDIQVEIRITAKQTEDEAESIEETIEESIEETAELTSQEAFVQESTELEH